ncbi:response regulator (plasmid) [Novosphingobium sp. BL-8A]|uniref:response regulator n=1 Tax=Novosphingobium sp. BL-8A TaxID=3127639 RepID=UPI003757DF99
MRSRSNRARLLVVEDEYIIATELAAALEEEGFTVVGPAATVARGHALLQDSRMDGAILDINVRGESIFPLADELARDDVPFLFFTGYDARVIPDRFADVPCCQKPFAPVSLIGIVEKRIVRPC